MKLSTMLYVLLAFAGAAHAAAGGGAIPTIFAPERIAGADDDGAAAFTPDGATVYFMRGTDSFTLMESHRIGGRWSTPQVAPFSGQWRDLDPAMAPDGSYLLFVSNRPSEPGGQPLDAVHAGKVYDLELDTSALTPEQCAERIARALADPPSPAALRRMTF